MPLRSIIVSMLTLSATLFISAGQFNSTLSIGDDAPAWTDLPGTDGRKHSLAELSKKDVVVVVFTCNSCPAAELYEERIIAFAKKYCGPNESATLVAINVNTVPEDRLERMTERAKEKGFSFPYLYDESQKIGKKYGAGFTPEFFVLNKARKIVYMGAFDDRSPPGAVKAAYVEAAVQATLKGEKPAVAETQARGCKVRYGKK